MKITKTADWREALPFEAPIIAETVMPGEPARCVTCGIASDPLPRTALWAVKHRHPHDPAGSVRLYCADHAPRVAAPTPLASPSRTVGATRPAGTARPPRAKAAARAPRTAATPKPIEKPEAVCPDCFMVVPPSGICGVCGKQVA
ncbi:glucose-6-phosphate dehydrogenase [Microbacterium terrisoli]|uniref:glucose-6-phosphate dehydrogenase n=1 Tax=Microbacterium terrisoli TaxID=3242192 RepID=UPI00280499E7|nr:glucose-6-phosphate dehydrogenase [Microbacterium protaetiae]